ncbi:hypothetical protein MMC27_004900 [Xylographa pallens]|nr:hypothetical protein [Xylographa pallens]
MPKRKSSGISLPKNTTSESNLTTGVASLHSHRGAFKLSKLLDDTIVTLIVGKKRRAFKIHHDLLCSASDYFKAALDGKFKEAEEQQIEFSEEKSDVVGCFQLWLYSGSIIDDGESVMALEFPLLIGIYAFAESHLLAALQNHVIDLIIRKAAKIHAIPKESMIYSGTVASFRLRKLVIDMTARTGLLNIWQWDVGSEDFISSKDYLIDLVKALYIEKIAVCPQEQNFWRIRCDYHIHGEGEPRCSEETPNPDKATTAS